MGGVIFGQRQFRKYPLYADRPEHLQQRGFNRKKALTLVNSCHRCPHSRGVARGALV